jgi:hypothetical protein
MRHFLRVLLWEVVGGPVQSFEAKVLWTAQRCSNCHSWEKPGIWDKTWFILQDLSFTRWSRIAWSWANYAVKQDDLVILSPSGEMQINQYPPAERASISPSRTETLLRVRIRSHVDKRKTSRPSPVLAHFKWSDRSESGEYSTDSCKYCLCEIERQHRYRDSGLATRKRFQATIDRLVADIGCDG